jgi:hypothetical protein
VQCGRIGAVDLQGSRVDRYESAADFRGHGAGRLCVRRADRHI